MWQLCQPSFPVKYPSYQEPDSPEPLSSNEETKVSVSEPKKKKTEKWKPTEHDGLKIDGTPDLRTKKGKALQAELDAKKTVVTT